MGRNRYVRDRMMDRMMRGRDERNPYGSRGGYVRSDRFDSRNDYNDYREDYREADYYRGRYDEGYNGSDYHEADNYYHNDLKRVREQLKRKDKFNLPDKEVIEKARQMGVNFNEFEEDEFLFAYNLMMSEFGTIANEPHKFIAMAKNWLEQDDIKVSPSEKVAITLYEFYMPDYGQRRH